MPLPSWVRERTPRTRLKRSNRLVSSSAAMPVPVSETDSTASAPSRRSATRISPSNVNLNAFETRLSTIRSHISRSTPATSGSRGRSTTSVIPARSVAARNMLARSVVKAARSVGSRTGSALPASMRENSSRLLTSFCRRSALRKTTLRRSACSPSPASASASSAGPRISDSGVRNSWLTLEKKSVFARSSSASASARSRSASRARTLARLEAIWPATSSRKPRYSWSSARYGFRPAISSPAGSGRPESASGIANAWRGGSSHAPSGTCEPVEVDHGGRAVEPRDLPARPARLP